MASRILLIAVVGMLVLLGCQRKTVVSPTPSQPVPEATRQEAVSEERVMDDESSQRLEGTSEEGMINRVRRAAQKSSDPATKPNATSSTQNADVLVALRKTGCYGQCPVFEFQIMPDGTARYHGIRHSEREGWYAARLTDAQLAAVGSQVEAAGYFALATHYPDQEHIIADLPNTITTVNYGGRQHRVVNNHDAPADLLDFERHLFDLLDALDWEPVTGKD